MNLIVMIVALSGLLLTATFIFKYVWMIESRARSMVMNLIVLGCTVLFLLAAIEGLFLVFLIQPDGFCVTLCSKRWFSKYWRPINSYGYRDVEHHDLQDKKVLFVVGDSFVAGHGIEDHTDRFSNVLADKLGKSWEVVNIAKRGWDTKDEYNAIVSYPVEPDMIILSYFYNDIEGTATRAGLDKPVIIRPIPKGVKPFVEHSYFLNFSYWLLYRFRYAEDLGEAYLEFLSNSFSNRTIWNAHKKELFDIALFAETRDIRLMVLVFPNLYDVEGSRIYTSKIVSLLKSSEIKVIDLTDVLTGRDRKELIINRFDTHPNVELHREIGELLYEYIQWDAAV